MKRVNLILYRIVVILLSLVILTFSMVSNRFARYAAGSENSSNADVAAFNVGIDFEGMIDNELSKQYPIKITNESEVLSGFDAISLQFVEPPPKNMTLELVDTEGNPLSPEVVTDSVSMEFDFPYQVKLPPHESVRVQIRMTQDERTVYEEYDYTAFVTVVVYQIDRAE